ncbi:hypothetical protein U1Q18_045308 [Sarracenia purpurea var. burkii]
MAETMAFVSSVLVFGGFANSATGVLRYGGYFEFAFPFFKFFARVELESFGLESDAVFVHVVIGQSVFDGKLRTAQYAND